HLLADSKTDTEAVSSGNVESLLESLHRGLPVSQRAECFSGFQKKIALLLRVSGHARLRQLNILQCIVAVAQLCIRSSELRVNFRIARVEFLGSAQFFDGSGVLI